MEIIKEEAESYLGETIYLFSLINNNGIKVKISNYGGIITGIWTPDKFGKSENIVLGFPDISDYYKKDYLKNCPYFGAIIGRYCNRIAKGQFEINGKVFNLTKNEFVNHVHGGTCGFDKKVWGIESFQETNAVGVILKYFSRDGEEGYPGNLNITVIYSLNNENELKIQYKANTDQPTHCNFTNHSYFNLTAGRKSNVLEHELTIYANKYLEVNSEFIPKGTVSSVEGTPMDFRNPLSIGDGLKKKSDQLKISRGYNHCWVLIPNGGKLTRAAELFDPLSGRKVKISTTEPGIQCYIASYLDGTHVGKNNIHFTKYYGVSLETQHFPNTPNQSNFPSTLLNPGEEFSSESIFEFQWG
ncbi:MAG: aldose epimerase family protein [Bacteroidota bacterium]|nr:aldose epimerase family protein [Bacteroidota bacterium]MDP4274891.1 aldose epimerase family protein [Bacteroidota bacterium]